MEEAAAVVEEAVAEAEAAAAEVVEEVMEGEERVVVADFWSSQRHYNEQDVHKRRHTPQLAFAKAYKEYSSCDHHYLATSDTPVIHHRSSYTST